eukprot:CAMPEP_0172298736 /NCGR_PEP_ID=MMETSP1058-20130122/1255_1 /TAXON_ID=83371 /ORGANISM="Detonula confervacea, Strain CCMP 353" /LENGTH=90 /DNA_ID=CAMNT_0013008025 /DNA_START=107 /DNA_END=375 /DNA_ORIENTATION=-
MAGDVENAIICRGWYCGVSFWTGASNLLSLSKHYVQCINEAAKYHQDAVLYLVMASFNLLLYLSGETNGGVDVKDYDELDAIGERTNSAA